MKEVEKSEEKEEEIEESDADESEIDENEWNQNFSEGFVPKFSGEFSSLVLKSDVTQDENLEDVIGNAPSVQNKNPNEGIQVYNMPDYGGRSYETSKQDENRFSGFLRENREFDLGRFQSPERAIGSQTEMEKIESNARKYLEVERPIFEEERRLPHERRTRQRGMKLRDDIV